MNSQQIVHDFYNDLADKSEFNELKEVLMKVSQKLDNIKDDAPLINRLVNFIYYKGYLEHWNFTPQQEEYVQELAQIGSKAGLNGAYLSDYGNVHQFD